MSQKARVERLEQQAYPARVYAIAVGDLAGDALKDRLQAAHEQIEERDLLIAFVGGFRGGSWDDTGLQCWQF